MFKSHPAISDCAAVGEVIGDKTLVVVHVMSMDPKVDPNDLLHFGNTNLASHKAPKIVYITSDFPRTKNGKILRRAINKEQALRFSNL